MGDTTRLANTQPRARSARTTTTRTPTPPATKCYLDFCRS
jgi:hypothetical protein